MQLDMDLETTINLGTPRRATQRQPEETAEGMKANFMQIMGIETEEEWKVWTLTFVICMLVNLQASLVPA